MSYNSNVLYFSIPENFESSCEESDVGQAKESELRISNPISTSLQEECGKCSTIVIASQDFGLKGIFLSISILIS